MYHSNLNDFYDSQYKAVKLRAKINTVDGVFEAANLILVLGLGGVMVLHNELTVGSLFTLALARIFLDQESSIIILDEPTSALDIISEDIVIRNIMEYKKESIIIMITHRQAVLKYCDYIMKIDQQKLNKEAM